MKRIIALALAALLALTAVSAAAEVKTIEEKFYQQAFVESAYRGTITFSVQGDKTDALDDTLWKAIKALAPRLSVKLDHTTSRAKGEGQATVTLLLDNNENAKTIVLYDDKLTAVSSTLLGGANTFYTAARDWDWSRLVQSLAQGESAWPPVWRMILAASTASEEWRAKADKKLSLYETKLELWLNSYVSYSSGTEGSVPYTQMSFTIPGKAVKQEIKALLLDFYNDAELLTLLREVVSAQEAAAYLQPTMMDAMFKIVDGMKLDGHVELVRRYDAKGNSLLDYISLPFPAGSQLSALTVTSVPQDQGKRLDITGSTAKGADFQFTCVTGEEGIYTGDVTITLPEEEGNGFVVSDSDAQGKTVAFTYSLSWEPGEEEYTLSTDKTSRTMRGSLLIRPMEEGTMPVQAVTLEINFSSRSSQRASTALNASLSWRDMDTDASITANLTSKTVSPFPFTSPSSLSGALRLDLMTQESRAALLKTWTDKITAFAALLLQSSGFAGVIPLATVKP